MRPPSLIVNVNLFAFGGLEATFLWPILLGLYWRKAEKYGALSSIVLGLVSYILIKTVYVIKFIEPVVISLSISLVAFVIVSLLMSKKQLKK
jgi:sodium/pantothenate symporter